MKIEIIKPKIIVFRETAPFSLLERLKIKRWYRHGVYRDTVIFSAELASSLSREWFQMEGIKRGMENAIQLGPEFFIVQDEFDAFRAIYDEKLKQQGIIYLKKYIQDYESDLMAAINKSEKIGAINTRNLTNQELANLFLEHFKSIQPLHHWLWSMEFLNESFDRFVRGLAMKQYPQWRGTEVDAFLMSVAYASKKQFFQKEQAEILKLKNISDPALSGIYQRYRWLKMHLIDSRPFVFGEYKKRVQEILNNKKELINKLKEQAALERGAAHAIHSIKNKEFRDYLLFMQELIYLKTYRIDVYTIVFYLVFGMRKEIIKRLSISPEQFLRHTKDEVVAALLGNSVDSSEIEQRKTYGVVKVDNEIEFIKGRAVKNIKDIIWGNIGDMKEIRGTIAYPGIARGKARVILTSREIGKVMPGEILVCNLTNPDYNPVFKKINAVITDEGGVLCHSAIMAREFKIPCIIGTKVATKVLQDGDMVEVDAERGVIKRLG